VAEIEVQVLVEYDIRWVQRFSNFEKSYLLLSEIDNYDAENSSNLEREGFIQRFETLFELTWKTLKDYLEFLGHSVQPSPRPILKEAFKAGIITEGQTFIEMLESRNNLSHTYDEKVFEAVFLEIKHSYFPAFTGLYNTLKKELP
jgi:nucleotidyltransferase substrate binding protein (TIGR01987 family)